jgi:hypothetical protein
VPEQRQLEDHPKEVLIYQLKRLMALGSLHAWVSTDSGHRWIEWSEGGPFGKTAGYVRSKVYGGVSEALDRVDTALEARGNPNLVTMYDEWSDELPL